MRASRAGRTLGRRAALGGVAGPVLFAASWRVVGRRRPGYSAVVQPISRLAAHRSSTRPAMTVGFAGYAAGIGAFAASMVRTDRKLAAGLVANAASMVAVAALPLDAPYGDTPHVAAASAAYLSLALLPLLHARPGRGVVDVAAGIGSGSLLVLSQAVPSRRGLFQRMGLSVGHIWIAGRAVGEVLRGG